MTETLGEKLKRLQEEACATIEACGYQSSVAKQFVLQVVTPDPAFADCIIGLEQRVSSLESTLAAREAEIGRLKKLDDPQFDATDYAHPAWWRGHDNATAVICQKIHEVLDGKDDGQGGNHEPWGAVRRRLIEVASQLAAANQRIEELEAMEAILDNRKGEL